MAFISGVKHYHHHLNHPTMRYENIICKRLVVEEMAFEARMSRFQRGLDWLREVRIRIVRIQGCWMEQDGAKKLEEGQKLETDGWVV